MEQEKNLTQSRMERTLSLWNKLQERIEEALDAKDLPAAMISSISKTLIEQFKMDKTSPEKAAEALSREEEKEEVVEVSGSEFMLPFPIDPVAETLEANLEEAADIGEGENKEWNLEGRLQIDS